MTNMPILFPSAEAANAMVAGVPSAARAARGRACEVVLVVPGGWAASPTTRAELARLAPKARLRFAGVEALGEFAVDGLSPGEPQRVADILASPAYCDPATARRTLDREARRIVAATGKPIDGLVSRHLNRPVSQFLSRQLLRFAWVRPVHATLAAALIGAAMALALFCGGVAGLYAGAVLFQLASIVDGMDGEIARATRRSSKFGASLDAACDAVTNFAFIGGLAFNLAQQGEVFAARIGLVALACLALGLAPFGVQSLRRGGPLSFEALKHEASVQSSAFWRRLAALASRDVYAFAFAVLVLIGLAAEALIGFALVVFAWLGLVLVSFTRPLWPRQP